MKPAPEMLLETTRFSVERIHQTLQDGSTRAREVVRHPGSVVVVPEVDADHVCLIHNSRVAVDQTLIELPAGTLDPNEDPRDCAFRELTEETGFHANQMTALISFFAAPGILDERMHLFVATDLMPGEPAREPGEEIENLVVTWDEAFRMIRENEIVDAKTIVGLFHYRMWRDQNSRASI